MIIALAGHVDHGKTALIQALTGIDTDRLAEEKRRGMTIDLGFAHADMGGGMTVGFVDVPGHERFLANMLAGVLSIDTVLLIIAADDGPMPQTHEHLSILRLTGASDVTAIITKTDRVDAAGLAGMHQTVAAYLAGAGYQHAPIIAVSSRTGDGIDTLRAFLANKAASLAAKLLAPGTSGGFRLPIDRGFIVAGTGLVVTGTVAAGTVAVGDRLVLSPSRLTARVRGIQVHHAPAGQAVAGDRCALAIAGAEIEKASLRRGDWLVSPALHAPTQRIDVLLRPAEGRRLRHASRVHIHTGSARIGGRALTLSGGDLTGTGGGDLTGTGGGDLTGTGGGDLAGGGEFYVSLTLDQPTAALYGDRIVLTDDASNRVVAGGRVIDPFSPTRRVRRDARVESLRALAIPDAHASLHGVLAADGWVDLRRFELARNLAPDRIDASGITRIGRAARPVLVSQATTAAIAAALIARLTSWHARHPERIGPDKTALLAGAASYPVEIAEAVLLTLLADGQVLRQDAAFRLPAHNPALPELDQAYWTRIERLMEAAGLKPPRVRELAETLALAPDAAEALLIRLERFGLVLRVAPNRFFPPGIVVTLGEIAAELAEDGGFTAARFNQRTGIGRNLTIEVLEFLDRIGVTQRDGELRHVARPVAEVLG